MALNNRFFLEDINEELISENEFKNLDINTVIYKDTGEKYFKDSIDTFRKIKDKTVFENYLRNNSAYYVGLLDFGYMN